MGRQRASQVASNRVVFYAIIGLAVLLILCTLVTRAVGWPRVCGGGLFVIGLVFLVLANEKRWPGLVIMLAGVALFFIDSLQALLAG